MVTVEILVVFTDYCRDGQGIYVAETYLPCSLLVEANDSKNAIYGVFTNRVDLCRTAVHDCCRTCGHILQVSKITSLTFGMLPILSPPNELSSAKCLVCFNFQSTCTSVSLKVGVNVV